jgi:hypothetical protein
MFNDDVTFAPMHSSRLKLIAWWLPLSLIAVGICSLRWDTAHFAGEYFPFGNDAFYHARRILDTVADPSAFYQFDAKIHAPEGSLLTWPWGYDYAMAMVVRTLEALGVSASPIAILIWLPVAFVLLPIGLIMLIARRLGLSHPLVVMAGLATALLPLTQNLYAVGQIDHHFAEHIFVLATIACGLRWFSRPHDTPAAITLGVVLAAATTIQNGLFILQLPILATMLGLWAQGTRMPMRTTLSFAAALVLTQLAVLLPSLPFQLGLFEFYTLSWYHLYVATGTALAALALSHLATSKRNFAVLVCMALLLLPLARQFLIARAFLGGTIARLDTIVEARSLIEMLLSPRGRQELTLTYSALVWLVPLTVLYCAWQGWQERATPRLFFWIWCVFGLALLTAQLRLQYFGSFALFMPWLVLAQQCMTRWPGNYKVVTLSMALLLALMYWMPGRYQLSGKMALAGDPNLAALRPILDNLKEACAREPGIVLADNDSGHYVRYYTQCSVIANNFLLTPQHEQKIRQIDYLFSVPAAAFPGVAPFVRYILVRPVTIMRSKDEMRYMSFSQRDGGLIADLLLKPLDKLPASYVVIGQANIHSIDAGTESSAPFIRLFKVNPVAPRPSPAVSSTASLKHVDK